jgi:hypothetical protein
MEPRPYTPADFEAGDPRLMLEDADFRYQPHVVCGACEHLLRKVAAHVSALHANETQFNSQGFESRYNLGDITTSARLGCHFCQIIVILDTWHGKGDPASSVSLELKWTLDAYARNGHYNISMVTSGTRTDLVVHQEARYAGEEQANHRPVCAPPLGRRTDDDDTFRVATGWLHTCLKEHAFCADRADKSLRPKRLLALSWFGDDGRDQDPSVRLIEAAGVPAQEEYVALSHCWGKKIIITTLSKTEQQFRQGIDFQALSKTFRDAVKITLRLGYRLLWIDSLCIIQDSTADWAEQAAIMGSVYANSALTIAALDSPDGAGGCFTYGHSRLGLQPLHLPDMDIVIEPPAHDEWFVRVHNTGEQAPPLHQRAWVVQERVLAPRTLYYGAGSIYWECRHVRATEKWTENTPPRRGFRLRKLLLHEVDRDTTRAMMGPREGSLYQELAATWRTLLLEYTGCMLTRWTDRLAAVEGLIAEMAQRTGLECVLGIWTHDLPGMLMWQRGFLSGDGAKYPPKRLDNQMPTWTWTSLPGRVDYQLSRMQNKTLWQAEAALEGADRKTLRVRSCRRKIDLRREGDTYRFLALDPEDERSRAPQQWGGDTAETWSWEADLAAPRPEGTMARTLWAVPMKIFKWSGYTFRDGGLVEQCATAGCLIVTAVESAHADDEADVNRVELDAANTSPEHRPSGVFLRLGFAWMEWTSREGSPFQIARAEGEHAGPTGQDEIPDGLENLLLV